MTTKHKDGRYLKDNYQPNNRRDGKNTSKCNKGGQDIWAEAVVVETEKVRIK